MIEVTLQAIANQSFSITLDGSRYNVALKLANGGMVCDMARDGVTLFTAARVVAGAPLIPYAYQQLGNFALITEADALPDYAQFGITQFLVYVTPAEIETLRGT